MSERSERQRTRIDAIVRTLQQSGTVSIDELCQKFGASVATVRRDLQQLESQGMLRRTHGGAVPIEPLFYEPFRKDASFVDLMNRYAEEKRRIAQAAAELVVQGNRISLTAGTTTTEIIRCLRYKGGIEVVTNTVNVAMELAKQKDIDVFVTGGHLRGDWFSLVGPSAIESLRRTFVDITFLGANGIDVASGLTCHNPDEAEVNKTMVAQAKMKIAVVDHSKLGLTAAWSICPVTELDLLITDRGATEEQLEPFKKAGISIRAV